MWTSVTEVTVVRVNTVILLRYVTQKYNGDILSDAEYHEDYEYALTFSEKKTYEKILKLTLIYARSKSIGADQYY